MWKKNEGEQCKGLKNEGEQRKGLKNEGEQCKGLKNEGEQMREEEPSQDCQHLDSLHNISTLTANNASDQDNENNRHMDY